MKRYLSLILAFVMVLSSVLLTSCQIIESIFSTKEPEVELNIIDDNNRNWYEIFVYSFYDTNNDGIGDLNGVTQKLDYIQEMGFNGIWLMPIHPSPTYHKYDVTDYYAIDEVYGTLEDLDNLVTEAHKRGINVILDLVVNHTSESHPYFQEACQYIRENGKPGGKYGDYYNFRTDQQSNTAYSAVSGTKYQYEANFWSGMPDLNLDSSAVRAEIVNIMEYWLVDHNVDGFRLDAVTSYYKGNINKNVEFLNWLNTEAKKIKPDCYIVGEAWEGNDYIINRYYDSGVDSFFLFTGAQADGKIASLVKQQSGKHIGEWMVTLQDTYTNGILAPFLGNHDTSRPGSFMPGIENVKMAAGVLSMMNGSTFVYYGEEIGMISKGANNSDPAKRIAMKWQAKSIYEGCCYLPPENTKVDDSSYYYPSVEEQLEDPDSILNYYKTAMQLRNRFPSIARGEIENLHDGTNNYICVLRKTYGDESIIIVMNLDSFAQKITLGRETVGASDIAGELYISSSDKAVWESDGSLTLPPYSIVILK